MTGGRTVGDILSVGILSFTELSGSDFSFRGAVGGRALLISAAQRPPFDCRQHVDNEMGKNRPY